MVRPRGSRGKRSALHTGVSAPTCERLSSRVSTAFVWEVGHGSVLFHPTPVVVLVRFRQDSVDLQT